MALSNSAAFGGNRPRPIDAGTCQALIRKEYQIRQILLNVEAPTGIEPVYTDLQSAASPLRHRAPRWCVAPYQRLTQFCQSGVFQNCVNCPSWLRNSAAWIATIFVAQCTTTLCNRSLLFDPAYAQNFFQSNCSNNRCKGEA